MEQNIYNAIYKVNHAGGCGSCFYLKQYDLFVTNYHVVEGFRQVAIQDNDKNSFLARVVMVNSVLDIALLSVEGDFSALPDIRLSELKEVAIGQKINVAGYPFGMPFTVTEGTVSSPRQLINNSYYIQTDAAVNPGNSGGPMFNERGELIAITASKITDADNMGFGIPVDTLKKVLENIEILAEYPDRETLATLDYRSKKELTGAIRIVTIPGADVCACCGTHVKYTGEVGPIKVISAEHAKGGSRLDILIGEKALADYKCRFENTQKISALLSVKPEQTAEAAQKLLQTVADLKQELGALKLRLLEEKVDAVETGSSACVLFEQGLSTVDVRKLADKLAQKVLFAAVFNGSDTDGYQYVICASDRDVSAFGKAFNKALCGRGGGKNPMIQGQVKAEQKAIWEYLTKGGVLQDGK